MKTTSKESVAVLRRYTSLPALLHLLHNEQITLLSPATWDDRNDAFYMGQYKNRRKVKTVLALCFSEARETYHHWKVFTHGSEGVCIEFKRDDFLAAFETLPDFRKKAVDYKAIKELEESQPPLAQLPFLKRLPYEDEREFRIVCIDRDDEIETKSFDIDLSCINRITLNPWMPKALADAVKVTIHSIKGCKSIGVYQTTLLENERWKKAAVGKSEV